MQLSEELLIEYRWALQPKVLEGQFLLLHMAIAAEVGIQEALADQDHLSVRPGTLSRWLNGWKLGARPLQRMAEIACSEAISLSQKNLCVSEFKASYVFLREARTLGKIDKDDIPGPALKFLELLDLPTMVGQPLPPRSNKFQADVNSAESRSANQNPRVGETSEKKRPSNKTQRKQAELKKPDFVAPTSEYVARPKKIKEIKTALLATGRETRNVALTTVLHGFGGFGKTTLAKEIYNDPVVRDAFTDGVYWVQCQQTLSLKPEAIVGSLLDRFALDWDKGAVSDPISAKRELVRAIGDKQMLLIVDDVWYNAHAEVFRGLPLSCVVLMTTRMKHLVPHGMSKILVDAMEPDEALNVMTNLQRDGEQAELSRTETADLKRLAQRLGYWAQLLALAKGRIQESYRRGEPLNKAISNYLSLLEKRGIVVADGRDQSGSANEARSIAMGLCVDASLKMLTDREWDHFQALGILPKDADIPVDIVSDYWREGLGTEADESQELLEVFADMSLLQLSLGEDGQVALHDNIIDYLDRRLDDEAKRQAHQNMVDAIAGYCRGTWENLPGDHQYGWLFLLIHLEAAGQQDQAN